MDRLPLRAFVSGLGSARGGTRSAAESATASESSPTRIPAVASLLRAGTSPSTWASPSLPSPSSLETPRKLGTSRLDPPAASIRRRSRCSLTWNRGELWSLCRRCRRWRECREGGCRIRSQRQRRTLDAYRRLLSSGCVGLDRLGPP